jgi:hypothetical protein
MHDVADPQYDTVYSLLNIFASVCFTVPVYKLHIYHNLEPELSPCVCMKIRHKDPALLSFTAVCITESVDGIQC